MTPHSTLAVEEQFERELEVFRTEAETAAQFFYAFLAIQASAGAKKAVHRLLNTAPLLVPFDARDGGPLPCTGGGARPTGQLCSNRTAVPPTSAGPDHRLFGPRKKWAAALG